MTLECFFINLPLTDLIHMRCLLLPIVNIILSIIVYSHCSTSQFPVCWFWCIFYILMVLKSLLYGNISSDIQEERRWIQNPFVFLGWIWNKIMVFNNENSDFNPLTDYCFSLIITIYYGPVDVCLLEFGNGGIWTGCGIFSELVMKTP